MVRVGGRGGGVGVERGVGRGGIGDIRMVKSARIGGRDRGRGIGRRGCGGMGREMDMRGGENGQEKSMSIEESGQEALRGEKMMIGRGVG